MYFPLKQTGSDYQTLLEQIAAECVFIERMKNKFVSGQAIALTKCHS